MDVSVFNRLRQQQNWVAPKQRCFGNFLDTVAFFYCLFIAVQMRLWRELVEIALVDYTFKLTICMLFFLPAYGVLLNFILRYFFAQRKSTTKLCSNPSLAD